MSRRVVPEEGLQILRTIGDPLLRKAAGGGHNTLVELHKVIEERSPGACHAIVDRVREHGLASLLVPPEAAPKPPAGLELPRLVDMTAVGIQSVATLDADRIVAAQCLFARFGTEIASALLLAALPQAYAAEWGSEVLAATEQLNSNLSNRIAGTARFLVGVMSGSTTKAAARWNWLPDEAEPKTEAEARRSWRLCTALRIYHAAIRGVLIAKASGDEIEDRELARRLRISKADDSEVPINQEDLLGMLLSFGITTFEVLERYGILWTLDEQEAYLHAWDVIGSYLGIGSPGVIARLELNYEDGSARQVIQTVQTALDGIEHADGNGSHRLVLPQNYGPPTTITDGRWHGLRPPTIEDSRALLQQLQARQWPSASPTAPFPVESATHEVRAGRLLLRALLDELAAAMPHRRRLVPLAVMRQLNPLIVRNRLNLGGGGAVLTALQDLPRRRAVVDRFTVWSLANPVTSRILRAMGNEVARRLSLLYLREGKLSVPGVDLSGEVASRRSVP